MENKHRQITIVINGKEQIERIEDTEHHHNRFIEEVTPEQSYPIENSQTPVSKKKRKWLRESKKKLAPIKKVWLSAVTALFIGSTFGMLMLMMFTGENSGIENVEGQAMKPELRTAASPTSASNLNLKLYVIQGGAFETKGSAEKFSNALIKKGYAAVIDETEKPFRMYIAIGTSDGKIEALAAEFEKIDQETYTKEIEALSSAEFDKEKTVQFIEEGKQLLIDLIKNKEALFDGQLKGSSQKKTTEKLKKWKEKWERANKDDITSGFADELLQADEAITAALNENKKTGWKAEQHLITAFIEYRKIVQGE
ncbi:hypothetical protein DCC39_10460 [Pueribacillus theae]|uniref:SPOR domain-containing protein n=1 Tax=Pueribacillus theae TaxID=2171751 RepID=A0A2U1JZP9_9BACI|nr:hypothetical protein [Pueribacillus theae]PWA10706.1 hypothetical protein DCC39_10460 [Pueribacillus theae]